MIFPPWALFTYMLNSLKEKIYFRQHPDAALRYFPIVDLLKKYNFENSKILEIGSGAYGIAPYLKKEVSGVDVDFTEPQFPLLKQFKGSALSLPFDKNSFDICIVSDVLEHLPADNRAKAVGETVRVARQAVVISGPFGKNAAAQDKKLADYSIKKTGHLHPFFADHIEYGLPEVEDVEEWVRNNAKVKSIEDAGQYFNLGVRQMLMKFFITDKKPVFYFYLKGLMPLVPFLRRVNKPPCYRRVFLLHLRQ